MLISSLYPCQTLENLIVGIELKFGMEKVFCSIIYFQAFVRRRHEIKSNFSGSNNAFNKYKYYVDVMEATGMVQREWIKQCI